MGRSLPSGSGDEKVQPALWFEMLHVVVVPGQIDVGAVAQQRQQPIDLRVVVLVGSFRVDGMVSVDDLPAGRARVERLFQPEQLLLGDDICVECEELRVSGGERWCAAGMRQLGLRCENMISAAGLFGWPQSWLPSVA